jgi:hypothetical protein
MYHVSEVFIFLVSTGVLLFMAVFSRRIVFIPFWRFLLAAFLLYWASTAITIAEGFVFPAFLNFIEHLCRSAFPVLIIVWAWLAGAGGTPDREGDSP